MDVAAAESALLQLARLLLAGLLTTRKIDAHFYPGDGIEQDNIILVCFFYFVVFEQLFSALHHEQLAVLG